MFFTRCELKENDSLIYFLIFLQEHHFCVSLIDDIDEVGAKPCQED